MKNSTIPATNMKTSTKGRVPGLNFGANTNNILQGLVGGHVNQMNQLSALETAHNRNTHMNVLNNLKEFYSMINDVEVNKDKLIPNIVVTGYEGDGKSSLVEYLLSIDLFPLNFFNRKQKAPFKIQINRQFCAREEGVNEEELDRNKNIGKTYVPSTPVKNLFPNSTTPTNNNQNLRSKGKVLETGYKKTPQEIDNIQTDNSNLFDYKFYQNEEISFTDLADLHRHFEEHDLIHYVDHQGFINIRIEVLILNPENYNKLTLNENENFFFDCIIYEIDIKDISDGKYPIPNNSMFLLCSTSDKADKFEAGVRIMMESPNIQFENLDPVLAIFTKPDKLDNQKDYVTIQQLCSKYAIKYGFIRMRSYEERRNFPSLAEFYQIETKFYQEHQILNTQGKGEFNSYGLNTLLDFIYHQLIALFKKNLKDNENNIKVAFDNEYSLLLQLGKGIPTDSKLRNEKLKRSLKILLKYVKELCDFTNSNLVSFIEHKLYECENNLQNNNNSNKSTTPLIRDLIKLKDADIKSEVTNNCSKEISKKLNKVNYTPNKRELEHVLFAISQRILADKIEKLKFIFKLHADSALNRIHTKISTVFSKIIDPFKEKLMIFFNDMLVNELNTNIVNDILKYDEIEKNFYYNKNKEFTKSFTEFYTSYLIPNNFNFDEKYSDFASESITQIIKDKLKSMMEHYCKTYAYYFYSAISEKMSDMSVESLIEVNFDKDLDLYTEDEEVKMERDLRKENLGRFVKMSEIMNKIQTIMTAKNVDCSVMTTHKSFLRTSTNMSVASKNVSYMSPYFKEMVEKFDKLCKMGAESLSNVNSPRDEEDSSDFDFYNEESDNAFILGEDEDHLDFINFYHKNSNFSHHSTHSNDQGKPSQFFTCYTRKNKEYVMVWDNTNQISVYNYEQNKIIQQSVKNIPGGQFLEDNRYINVENQVFISGGVKQNGERSKLFMEIKRPQNEIVTLKPLPEARVRHSLIYFPEINALALIGGSEAKKTFIYKISEMIWEDFGDLNMERTDPSLFLSNNNIIFCMGGVRNKNSQTSEYFIEYKRVNMDKNWHLCNIKLFNEQNDLLPSNESIFSLAGVGLCLYDSSQEAILILGGYDSNSLEDSEKCYELYFQSSEIHIKEIKFTNANQIQSWFPENNFVQFDKNGEELVNFNVDGEIVKYSLTKKEVEILPFKFTADSD